MIEFFTKKGILYMSLYIDLKNSIKWRTFMLREVFELGKIVKKTSIFVSGVVVGSLGLKVLANKDTKHIAAKAVAVSYKLKDGLDATVSQLKQHADDVLAEANDLYVEEKAANLATVETSEQ